MQSGANERRNLPNSTCCFICGEDNPAGLRSRFYVEDGAVKMRLRVGPHHCGIEGIVHGGITAAVLDETMAWAATRAVGRMCVTGDLTVRYLRRVPCGLELTVTAKATKANRRIAYVEATLTDDDGHEYARGEARFIPISAEETLRIDDTLLYREGDERVFDELRTQHARDSRGG